jgi:DNA-binding SARP family transcriptional activator
MTQLHLALLGPFAAQWGDQPVTKFPTDKVRALLAYLALEGERPLRRETLAALLWPDWTDEIAKRNLRQNLHRLTQLLDGLEPGLSKRLLTITRPAVRLNREWIALDVVELEAALTAVAQCDHRYLHACAACGERLTAVADLIRGELLAGLSLPDAPAFEEWLAAAREAWRRPALHLLHSLTDRHLQRGEYERAEAYAARQIGLEPGREEAQRQMMLALARQGRRGKLWPSMNSFLACWRRKWASPRSRKRPPWPPKLPTTPCRRPSPRACAIFPFT